MFKDIWINICSILIWGRSLGFKFNSIQYFMMCWRITSFTWAETKIKWSLIKHIYNSHLMQKTMWNKQLCHYHYKAIRVDTNSASLKCLTTAYWRKYLVNASRAKLKASLHPVQRKINERCSLHKSKWKYAMLTADLLHCFLSSSVLLPCKWFADD